MPVKTISNPGGLYGLTADPASQIVAIVVNNSGGTLIEGDVVVCTDVAGIAVTTTTSGNSVNVVGVVGPAGAIGTGAGATASIALYAAGATMPVIMQGPGRVNIGANTVAAGSVLTTFTTVKQAQTIAAAVGQIGAVIGVSLESQAAKDVSNTIRCFIKLA
jgi:hypothetical protein